MQPKLPVNAQAFFTDNKPKKYVYLPGDARKGLITGRSVETAGVKQENIGKIENQPAHLVPPHLQPKITPDPVTKTETPTRPFVPHQSHRQVVSRPVKQSAPVARCKYMGTLAYNASCSCSSLVCNNPECPLSQTLAKGGKMKLHGNSCNENNCRWFTK